MAVMKAVTKRTPENMEVFNGKVPGVFMGIWWAGQAAFEVAISCSVFTTALADSNAPAIQPPR